ncbi:MULTISPECIES: PAS domain-containing sensor histidine kinase [unclassified Arcicella]|uniref:sensor histidine kinase n=1 Tax=unclassified Arcicella TaxID=2644986 RepID=UPI002864D1DC|nr:MULTISPECIES: PAS domain-containing sensor histidine kinase [unclassified Arcicella]MDR6563467.1 PAS domain S-box-containing protein [Arcicella sp. BE51]MDR6813421.1 PAS domain S-box-containing protein [Arcicella sp. BE140]MDR6824734.1 PAS domain S-box-containing protein [Arcicella sp. BE139]
MVFIQKDIVLGLRFILNEVPYAVLLEDNQRKLQFVNPSFCKLFSIPLLPEQMVGFDCAVAAESSAQLFKDSQAFLERVTEILEKKEPVRQELLELVDGRFFLRDYLPIINNNLFEGQVWIYYDYTEAYSSEIGKNKLKKFYENILLNIPADIVVFDKEHRYLFVNKKAIQNQEIREWIIGKDDFEYVKYRGKDISIAQKRRALFNHVINNRASSEIIEETITPLGTTQYNLRRIHPFYTDDNELDLIVGYGIDITSIKNAEELINRREKNLAQITEILNIAVIVIDKSFNVTYANSSFDTTFGYIDGEIIGKKIDEIKIANFSSIRDEILFSQKKDDYQFKTKEFQFKDKYGSKKYLSVYCIPSYTIDTNEIFYAIFFSDVTDQHLAFDELQKIVEKEKRLNELKSGFVNIVSHEMRTPLSVIQSSAQIIEMLSENDNLDKEAINFHTTRIVSEVVGMETLMDELLLISKIESGKVDFKPFPQDLENFVRVVIHEKYAQLADDRQIKVIVKGEKQQVAFDRMMMNHILSNIIGNAFKYSEGKQAPIIQLHYRNNAVSVMVVDSGIGIPEKDLQNLFKAFSRASNVDGVKGTGLGLHVVKFFVDFHNAKISCRSQVNKGTSILLEFNYKSFSNA